MEDFIFKVRPEIHFGAGITDSIGEIIRNRFNSKKALIVCDSVVRELGYLNKLSDALGKSGISSDFLESTEPEPSDIAVEKCYSGMVGTDADIVIAMGGGSCIDLVKAARVLLNNPGPLAGYAGANKVVNAPGIPLVAVVTTAGSGSECTTWAVISHPAQKTKFAIGSPYLAATLNIYDPVLTADTPPLITASTGLDAFSHAIESHASTRANTITRAISGRAIALMSEALPRATRDGQDISARSDMMLGSCMAMLAAENTLFGLCHAFASPIGGRFKVPHRIIIGILLPYVLEYNSGHAPSIYKEIAVLMGKDTGGMGEKDAARQAAARVREIIAETNVPARLSETGVAREGLPEVAKICSTSFHLSTNPAPINEKQLLDLLYSAF